MFKRPIVVWLVFVPLVASVLCGAAAGISVWRFGSLAAGLSYVRGDAVHLETSYFWLGEVSRSETISVPVEIQNLCGEPIRVLGAQSSCYCVVVSDLPVEMGSLSACTIEIQIDPTAEKPGEIFSREVRFVMLGEEWIVPEQFTITIEGSVPNNP